MRSFESSIDPPFAAEGGLAPPRRHEADPYRALDDLMAAVEALCPTWPQRETFSRTARMLL